MRFRTHIYTFVCKNIICSKSGLPHTKILPKESKNDVSICSFIRSSIVKLDFVIRIEIFVTGLSIDQRDILNGVEIMTVVNIP